MENGKISLEEYKHRAQGFFKAFGEWAFCDHENEIFTVHNVFRNDVKNTEGAYEYSYIFSKYENFMNYVWRADDTLYESVEEVDDEEICYYWEVAKYRLTENNEYELIYVVSMYCGMWIFDVRFSHSFIPQTETENKLFSEWMLLTQSYGMKRLQIMFPYKIGDIIKVGNSNIDTDFTYYIFCSDKGEVIGVDDGGLYINSLYNRYSTSFEPLHYECISECPEQLKNARNILMRGNEEEKRNLMNTILSRYKEVDISDTY